MTPRGTTILGGRVEVFLVSRIEPLVWEALVRPGRALLPGARHAPHREAAEPTLAAVSDFTNRLLRDHHEGELSAQAGVARA